MALEIFRTRRFLAGVSLVALVVTPAFTLLAQTTPVDTTPAVVVKDAPEKALATAIGFELSKHPVDTSAEDFEAFIVFVLTQKDYTPDTVEAALDIVGAAPNVSDPMKAAIDKVKAAYAKRKIRPGTAAISDGGGGFGGSFSSPGANIGGGSTNYS